ncbi:mycofactocin biosynthesis peptidyl-dipeptidase MftE [Blastococcus sp. Marseille-P5729]|uniref:mycofactocin biosynthesis peptidyl-dipeptidase MftE n=1 Tax=Blastococcus sp. Marseille-P5729 TaxID=2086582 RepID=UPI000D101B75|nr:mycofactocin biosynthesis peptidyl-dipeptidase MftE [Blastococcus sp. Marseille-P5729]
MIDLSTAASIDLGADRPDTLVVPLGSTEQHGAHLPLATDTIIASYVAREIAARLDRSALAPSIPFGASGEHSGFAGTLSIGTEVLARVLVELVRDASRDYAKVVVVNGHGGNGPAIAAAQEVCDHEGRELLVAHCHFPGADAHAGRTETSVLLYIAPGAVRLDLAEPGNTAPIGELMPKMREAGIRAVSKNGVLGDPTGASAEEGAALLDDLIGRIVQSLGAY